MATNDLPRNSWTADQMQARGFDTTFETPAVEVLGADTISSPNSLRRMAVDANGRIILAGFGVPSHDYISLTQDTTTDTWTYKTGGSGGTTVATITVTFTDSTKVTISNVAKT